MKRIANWFRRARSGVQEAPAPHSTTPAEKRDIRIARIEAHIAKLERKGTPAALAKIEQHRRELEALSLEAHVAAIRSGNVVVTPAPATLELN